MPHDERTGILRRHTREAVRATAVLRLPLVGLMALLGTAVQVSHWQPFVFTVLLIVYGVLSLIWLVVVFTVDLGPWSGWTFTVVDVVAVVSLCVASGGATALLLPVFFLLPISVAFQYRPGLTAVVGLCTAVGYQIVWVVYSKRDDTVGFPDEVYLYFGFLLWLAAATTALSYVLVRRSATVAALLDIRRRLVAESMNAEQRERRQLAEHLHDGPLQSVLVARMDVEEVRETHPNVILDAAETTLRDAASQLRSTVTTLHPQVLAQLGLTAALRELADFHSRRDVEVTTHIEEVVHPEGEELIYQVARELLTNVTKHAGATAVDLDLAVTDGRIVLTVADDGGGFDLSVVSERVAQGHIGLASHLVRVENAGGTFDITSTPGAGTTVVASFPT
ncbi:sensor histidine kinase [Rhodococcus sp. NPDC058521]|uniref:sensor histidine kinase n=1 Tax=Rhodococcus sp. NPDC058521 TaxID=3346536 RepID=UPI0036664F25